MGAEAADFALDETLSEDVLNGNRGIRKASQHLIIDLPALRVRKPQLHWVRGPAVDRNRIVN